MNDLHKPPEHQLARARQVADAVLYEGYILYPYRPSSTKNRQRWSFGGLYPAAYSAAQGGLEASSNQTECLVRGDPDTTIDIRLRFLHLCERQVAVPAGDGAQSLSPDDPAAFSTVAWLVVDGRRYSSWQEAVEREVDVLGLKLGKLATPGEIFHAPVAFPGGRGTEKIHDARGAVRGMLLRCQEPLAGKVRVSAAEVAPDLYRLTVQVANLTPVTADVASATHALATRAQATRDEALLQAFVSTHLILGIRGGQFISMIDPPETCRESAAACRNVGTYPVLVGEEGAHDLMLSSPIILYDYPQIAPESPGDLFDGTEIDEILSLRILTMTDEEKQEARSTDARACELLDRTETLSSEALIRLHGALRNIRPSPHKEP